MTFSINDEQLESITCRKVVQNMLFYLLEINDCDKSTSFVHFGVKDTTDAAADTNASYTKRKNYYHRVKPKWRKTSHSQAHSDDLLVSSEMMINNFSVQLKY